MNDNALNVKAVWKYPLEVTGAQEIELPYGAIFLSVMEQHNLPNLYALVNPYTTLMETWEIALRSTGQPIGEEVLRLAKFLGTVSTYGGQLVWHILRYEVIHEERL